MQRPGWWGLLAFELREVAGLRTPLPPLGEEALTAE
jgi:hypothetical protein